MIVVDNDKANAASIETVKRAVQALHDKEARDRGYDNINSCGKYCGYENGYRAECEALGAWVAACWDLCYSMLADWQAGNIPDPTLETVMEAMPDAPA